jgi:hypothetical protein
LMRLRVRLAKSQPGLRIINGNFVNLALDRISFANITFAISRGAIRFLDVGNPALET